tara:strand:- start:486 stop:632 length:147 start_codon:yes stop_codon:yes gene_type:complete
MLWVMLIILIAMMVALCVGYSMYKEKPAVVRTETVEVIKYVKEPNTPG